MSIGFLFVLVSLLSTAMTSGGAFLCWKRRAFPGALALGGMMLSVAWWSLTNVFEYLSDDIVSRVWWSRLAYFGILGTPSCYLLFALEYASRIRYPSRAVKVVLLSAYAIFMALALTDVWHHGLYSRVSWAPEHLLYYQHGIVYWIFISANYTVSFISGALLIYAIINFPRRYWKINTFIFASISVPFLVNALYSLGVFPKGMNFTSLGTFYAGACVCYGVLRNRIFDVMPISSRTLFERMREGMLVFDARRQLVDFNGAAADMMKSELKIGLSLENLPAPWNQLEQMPDAEDSRRHELVAGNPVERWYEINASVLRRPGGITDGFLFLIREITERKQLEARLRMLALRDALTGLYNRHYLDLTMEHDIARCRRLKTPLSLVMFDLDHFKAVNDRYGHQTGDLVLQAFGRHLLMHTRKCDFACRYGGEEFVLVLSDTSPAAAAARADVWRRRFGMMPIAGAPEDLRVTCSGGVAAFPQHGNTPEALIQAADEALYQAKRDGRNCVMIIPETA